MVSNINASLRWHDTKWRYTISWDVNNGSNKVELLREAGEIFILELMKAQSKPNIIKEIKSKGCFDGK